MAQVSDRLRSACKVRRYERRGYTQNAPFERRMKRIADRDARLVRGVLQPEVDVEQRRRSAARALVGAALNRNHTSGAWALVGRYAEGSCTATRMRESRGVARCCCACTAIQQYETATTHAESGMACTACTACNARRRTATRNMQRTNPSTAPLDSHSCAHNHHAQCTARSQLNSLTRLGSSTRLGLSARCCSVAASTACALVPVGDSAAGGALSL